MKHKNGYFFKKSCDYVRSKSYSSIKECKEAILETGYCGFFDIETLNDLYPIYNLVEVVQISDRTRKFIDNEEVAA